MAEEDFKPFEIVENSPYKETALIEEQEQELDNFIANHPYKENILIEDTEKITDLLVNYWNRIITDFENRTIIFALKLKELLKGYPDKTIKEVLDKMQRHPDLKQSIHSKDRIMQGLRLVNERPDLIAWAGGSHTHMEPPYLKHDGSIHWEFYFQLYKWNLDPGLRLELEDKAKQEKWSVRHLQNEMQKLQQEIAEPNTRRRLQKAALIKELVLMLKDLQPDDLNKLKWHIIDNHRDKLVSWKRYTDSLKEEVNKDGKRTENEASSECASKGR